MLQNVSAFNPQVVQFPPQGPSLNGNQNFGADALAQGQNGQAMAGLPQDTATLMHMLEEAEMSGELPPELMALLAGLGNMFGDPNSLGMGMGGYPQGNFGGVPSMGSAAPMGGGGSSAPMGGGGSSAPMGGGRGSSAPSGGGGSYSPSPSYPRATHSPSVVSTAAVSESPQAAAPLASEPVASAPSPAPVAPEPVSEAPAPVKPAPVAAEPVSEAPAAPHYDNWTPALSKSLDDSISGGPKNYGDTLEAFKQGDPTNCSTIGVIKALSSQDGNQMFQSVQKQEDGSYKVVEQDGYSTTVSPEELDKAAKAADFRPDDNKAKNNDEVRAQAILADATMAKRAQEKGLGEGKDHETFKNYDDALAAVNTNQYPKDMAKLMGIPDSRVKEIPPQDVANGCLQDPNRTFVSNSPNHSEAQVCVAPTAKDSNPVKNDQYGKETANNGKDAKGRDFTQTIEIVPKSKEAPAAASSHSEGSKPGAAKTESKPKTESTPAAKPVEHKKETSHSKAK